MKKLILLAIGIVMSITVAKSQCTNLTVDVSQFYYTPVQNGMYSKIYKPRVYFTPVKDAKNVAAFYTDPNRQYVQANDWCAKLVNGVVSYTNCIDQGYLSFSYVYGSNVSMVFRATDALGKTVCEVPFTISVPYSETYCTSLMAGATIMDNPEYTKNQVAVTWNCPMGNKYEITATNTATNVTTLFTVNGQADYSIVTLDYGQSYNIKVKMFKTDGTTMEAVTSITIGSAPAAVKPARGKK